MRARTQFHARVGKKIKEIRERLGLTAQELSLKAQMSLKTIESIEGGRRDIKVSELHWIARALNIRLSGFLNSCDYKVYERRKEETIDSYISIKKLSEVLDISTKRLKELCFNKEIPFYELNGKYFFKTSQINGWLQHHCGSRKKIEEKDFHFIKVFGVEPLISTKEAAQLLGCSAHEIYRLRLRIPYYRVGGRIKFRVSEIENAFRKNRVDVWEISTNIGSWRSSFVRAYPTKEEKMTREASWERRYSERARPGYIVKTKNFESDDFEKLKKGVKEYAEAHINKYNLLGCVYSFNESKRFFLCEIRWWDMPEGRENYRVHSAGLSSDSPDKLREKVARFEQMKVPPGDSIGVEYYTWGESFTSRCHQARITYYMPKKQDEGEETRAQRDQH